MIYTNSLNELNILASAVVFIHLDNKSKDQ